MRLLTVLVMLLLVFALPLRGWAAHAPNDCAGHASPAGHAQAHGAHDHGGEAYAAADGGCVHCAGCCFAPFTPAVNHGFAAFAGTGGAPAQPAAPPPTRLAEGLFKPPLS